MREQLLAILGAAALLAGPSEAQETSHASRYIACRAADGVDHRLSEVCEVVDTIPSRLEDARGHPRRLADLQYAHAMALLVLGDTGDDVAMRDCIEVSRASAEFYTRARAPTRWAVLQVNVGQALIALAERGDQAAASEAVEVLRAAADAVPRAQQPEFWAHAHETLADAYITQGRGADHGSLRSAAAELQLALEIYRRPRFAERRARVEERLAEIYRVLGDEPDAT
jgi:hypothetical protein